VIRGLAPPAYCSKRTHIHIHIRVYIYRIYGRLEGYTGHVISCDGIFCCENTYIASCDYTARDYTIARDYTPYIRCIRRLIPYIRQLYGGVL